jgi:hypothetical protein
MRQWMRARYASVLTEFAARVAFVVPALLAMFLADRGVGRGTRLSGDNIGVPPALQGCVCGVDQVTH